MSLDKKHPRKLKLIHIVLFKNNKGGNLRQLERDTMDKGMIEADREIIRLVNHKRVHKTMHSQ